MSLKTKRIKLEDIARQSGFSVSTVSLALRERPGIPEETRGRVLEAARSLGYKPRRRNHAFAVGLQLGLVRNIGLVVKARPDDHPHLNQFYSQVIVGIEAACRKYDLNVLLATILVDEQNIPLEVPSSLVFGEADGLLVVGAYVDQPLIEILGRHEQPWETETVIPDFEAKNPNIKVNLVIVTWDDFDTKMQAMIAAGTPPDIWSHWGPSGFQDYVKRGLVADLTPYIEKDKFDPSDFVPEVLDIYKVDGKVMGLPILTGGSFVFYNKDLFDKAGVSYPTTNWDDTAWTYDAFLEKCKGLTKVSEPYDPANDVFGCNMGFWPNDQFAWMYGQDFYPDSAYSTGFADTAYLDNPKVIQAFQDKQDIVWKLNYAPDPAETSALGSADIFKKQKVAMQLTGVWGWWNYVDITDFNWAVAALPYGGEEGRRDVVFTDPWMLSSKTAHPEEAWTLLKYLCSAEVQAQWTKLTGAPPVRKSLLPDWYKQFAAMIPAQVEEVFLGSLKYGRESPNHLLVKFDQLNQVVGSAVDPISNNDKTAAEALPAANVELIAALKQIQAEYQK